MGWKGTMRSVRAEIKRAEKRQIQYEKMQLAQQARDLVQEQEYYLERVKSFHKVHAEKVDWNVFIKATEPIAPGKINKREVAAVEKFENYRPAWLIRKLNLVEWRKRSLNNKIGKARLEDEKEYSQLMAQYTSEHARWKQEKELAERIVARDLKAYEEVLLAKSVFRADTIKCLAIKLNFDDGVLVVELDLVNEEDLLPSIIYSVTKTGKMSEKEFPKTQYNLLYQDYVCSVSLAVSKILFGLFPVDKILISAMANVLNTSNGNRERQPLLSAFMPRGNVSSLNFSYIDPSDSMKNFIHNMSFKTTEGLRPVKQLNIEKGQAS